MGEVGTAFKCWWFTHSVLSSFIFHTCDRKYRSLCSDYSFTVHLYIHNIKSQNLIVMFPVSILFYLNRNEQTFNGRNEQKLNGKSVATEHAIPAIIATPCMHFYSTTDVTSIVIAELGYLEPF